jgi:hypothetical protein
VSSVSCDSRAIFFPVNIKIIKIKAANHNSSRNLAVGFLDFLRQRYNILGFAAIANSGDTAGMMETAN